MGMGEKLKIILLLSVSLLNFNGVANEVKETGVERKLDLLKKDAVKSILSEDGDIIDCINIYKQPAFNHPALRNHIIQMTPSYNPAVESTTKDTKALEKEKLDPSVITITSQLWQKNGSCPKGTIPMRRIRKEGMLQANTLKNYGRKRPIIFSHRPKHLDNDNGNSYLLQQNHSMAILLTEGYNYQGAKGDIKVWSPFVETDDEYSTSQVALKNGPYMKSETVESGWAIYRQNGRWSNLRLSDDQENEYDYALLYMSRMNSFCIYGPAVDPWKKVFSKFSHPDIAFLEPFELIKFVQGNKRFLQYKISCVVNPSVYGDKQARLFVYWTADSSKETGCFDLTCPGFVQTSREIALGAAFNPISLPGDLSSQIIIYIFKDQVTNNWWVQYGERINIGYWPPNLFSDLKNNANAVEWGGEVYSSKLGTHRPHTKTEMGTGHYADYISQNSGWVKRMRVRQNAMELRFPEWAYAYSDEYDCYDAFFLSDYVEDPEFYYGGPGGKDPRCP